MISRRARLRGRRAARGRHAAPRWRRREPHGRAVPRASTPRRSSITVVMCSFAALLSIVKVLRLDPASVFKALKETVMTAALALSDTLPGRRIARRQPSARSRASSASARSTAPARHAVAALADATLDIRARRGHADRRPVGLRQDHADLDPRPAPHADRPARSGSRAGTSPGSASATLPALRARNFGFVFQGFNLFPALTALENVAIAIQMKDPRAKDPRGEARRLLELVGLGAAHASPARRSVGRPEAARRDRARARRQPADPRRRRADRRARHQDRAVGDGAAARAREHARPRRRRRHPRSAPRAVRRPRRPRRGRPHPTDPISDQEPPP